MATHHVGDPISDMVMSGCPIRGRPCQDHDVRQVPALQILRASGNVPEYGFKEGDAPSFRTDRRAGSGISSVPGPCFARPGMTQQLKRRLHLRDASAINSVIWVGPRFR